TALKLGGRVDVFPDSPLPDLNGPGGPAFTARFRGDASSDLVAFVCTSALPPRVEFVNTMRLVDNPSVMRLKETGVLHWPAHNAHYYTLVYERPVAPRYRHGLDATFPSMSEDAINHYFVIPMISALQEFQRTGI